VDGSIQLYATNPAAMERLAQCMARPPISLSKVTLEEQGANVLFHTKYNPSHPKAYTTSQLRYSASDRYGLMS